MFVFDPNFFWLAQQYNLYLLNFLGVDVCYALNLAIKKIKLKRNPWKDDIALAFLMIMSVYRLCISNPVQQAFHDYWLL